MSDSRAINYFRYILTMLLVALGFNVSEVITDPVGALTREIREVRAKLDLIDKLDDRLQNIERVVYARLDQ